MPRVLFLVTEDWYFVSHRFEFAKFLVSEGYEVYLGCRESGKRALIEAAGIHVISIPFAREKVSPGAVLKACWEVRKTIRDLKPDIVHLVALRSILIGWLASLFQRRPIFINAVTGMGSLFSTTVKGLKMRITKAVVGLMFRRVFRQPSAHTIWQNQDDFETFTSNGLCPKNRSTIIRGVGLDFEGFEYQPEAERDPLVVLFVGRLLIDKGIHELINASKALTKEGVEHRLRIVGEPDYCNPRSLTEEEIQEWKELEWIEFLGRREDVTEQMQDSNFLVMPSYREGLPQVLLEAGRAGRAVITSDVPGCREVVEHEKSGLLVRARDETDLAKAMKQLLIDGDRRRFLASNNFKRVQEDFSSEVIFKEMRTFYQQVTGEDQG